MKCMNVVAGLIVVVGMGAAVAQPPKVDGGRSEGHRMPPIVPFGPSGGMHGGMNVAPPMVLDVAELQTMLKEIGITTPTIDKVVSVTRKFINEFEGKLIKIQREELSIKEELLKEKPDLKVIQDCINRKTSVFGEIEYAQIKRDVEIKQMLTREEYERWKSVAMKKMRESMPEMMKHGKLVNGKKQADKSK